MGHGAAAVWFSDTIVVTTSGVQDLREIYGKKIIITRVRYVLFCSSCCCCCRCRSCIFSRRGSGKWEFPARRIVYSRRPATLWIIINRTRAYACSMTTPVNISISSHCRKHTEHFSTFVSRIRAACVRTSHFAVRLPRVRLFSKSPSTVRFFGPYKT